MCICMYLNHFILQQKLTQHYKSTIFQWHFKKDKKKKEDAQWYVLSFSPPLSTYLRGGG